MASEMRAYGRAHGQKPRLPLRENTDDLFVGKTLLHGDVLMWLMKTLLTSGVLINGAQVIMKTVKRISISIMIKSRQQVDVKNQLVAFTHYPHSLQGNCSP